MYISGINHPSRLPVILFGHLNIHLTLILISMINYTLCIICSKSNVSAFLLRNVLHNRKCNTADRKTDRLIPFKAVSALVAPLDYKRIKVWSSSTTDTMNDTINSKNNNKWKGPTQLQYNKVTVRGLLQTGSASYCWWHPVQYLFKSSFPSFPEEWDFSASSEKKAE